MVVDEECFGFGGKTPVPARPEALAFAEAMAELIEARAKLSAAQEKVPNYTGQWDHKDYYAEELERYYRAADALADAAKGIV
jgi:hypothetical protein